MLEIGLACPIRKVLYAWEYGNTYTLYTVLYYWATLYWNYIPHVFNEICALKDAE